MTQKVRVAIGLGSNLGDRAAKVREAMKILSEEFLEDAKTSNLYESEPWGKTDQPKFLNAVIVGLSEWKPPAIVNYLKSLERELGRTETVKNGPRVIDLDLLAYAEQTWEGEGVTVPHPGIPDRDFVILPWRELWPNWKHPALQKTLEEIWKSFPHPQTAKVV
jgi:2-amino-4-hydroxy-6-hydroxymethyldihydropteridine diphosphokinase